MTRKIKPPIHLYSALADATRCRIMEILLDGPMPVHRLADAFSISRPAISRHLRVLKTAGLVAEVKKGRENLYAPRAEKLGKASAWIDRLLAEGRFDSGALAIAPAAGPVVVAPPANAEPRDTPAPAATEKPARPIKPKRLDPIDQMGFDF